MRLSTLHVLMVILLASSGFASHDQDNIEFVCMKTHKASNTCHFNFKVDGANYRYIDIGCKYNKKKEELIEKVKDGSIFLAKDWKIECPAPKEEKSGL